MDLNIHIPLCWRKMSDVCAKDRHGRLRGGNEGAESAAQSGFFWGCHVGKGMGLRERYLPPGMKSTWPAWIRDGSASLFASMMSCAFAPVFFAMSPMESPFCTVYFTPSIFWGLPT